jgi:UDP-glucose 4-epimerase
VRLSNVIGLNQNSNTFLGQLLSLANKGKVTFESGPDSVRDYISINDVSKILYKMAFQNNNIIYNLASGLNYENRELANHLKSIYNCEVRFAPNSRYEKVQKIDVSRIKSEFNFEPESIKNVFDDIISNAKWKGQM